MPKGKDLFRSITARKPQGNKSANDKDSGQCSGEKMKEVEQTAADAVKENKETYSPDDTADIIGDMSLPLDSSEDHEKEDENYSPPDKPKRLFMITGTCKKKDAKHKERKQTAAKVRDDRQAKETEKASQQRPNADSSNKVQASEEASKRYSSDDEHPYEDPNVLVNNSSTPLQTHNKNKPSKLPKPKKTKSDKMKQEQQQQRPCSPSCSKSTENIKAAVKGLKERNPSVMSEHSIARSVFAFLVALLLSLIIFLALYFLLRCHPILAVVLAILLYTIVFMILGFLDATRLKCLILLALPSVCSQGGKLALYLLLLYFTIKGPLCNTIENIRSVRGVLKCVNDQRSDIVETTAQTFEAAESCVRNYTGRNLTMNQSMVASLGCLKESCSSMKEKYKRRCTSKRPMISPQVCTLARDLSCNNSKIPRNIENCPEGAQTPCQKELDEILRFLEGNEIDGCGFLEVIGMLLPLLVLLLFHEAYNYEKKYRTYNDFHNFFLTGHFQCIDQSRSSCDREAVLPLRKVELRKHVRPAMCHLSSEEKKLLCQSLKTYTLCLLLVLFVILIDYYTFKMFNIESDKNMDIAAYYNHSAIKNVSFQKIENNASSVDGNRTSNRTVNPTMQSNFTTNILNKSEDICSVLVDSPGTISKMIIPILLSVLLVAILFQAFIVRFQWCVCSSFYNVREKERVFYLYNKILEDRIALVEKCRKQMKCYNREMKTLKSLEPTRVLSQQARWLSKVLKFFHVNLRRCVICNDYEKKTFKICHGADCSGVYCLECSFDIDKKCLYCDTELKGELSIKHANNKQDVSSKESLV